MSPKWSISDAWYYLDTSPIEMARNFKNRVSNKNEIAHSQKIHNFDHLFKQILPFAYFGQVS